LNDDSRLPRKSAQQDFEVGALERHAAGGGAKGRPRDVQENRTASPGSPGPRVVVDLNDEVVEAVGALEPVPRLAGPTPNGAVVAPVGRIFAPGVGRADTPQREKAPRPGKPIGPPPKAQGMKTTARGAAIAFALIGSDAASA
jgi:hypothetical protein